MTETAKAPVRCGLSGTALKYIACITMLIDHIGASCIESRYSYYTAAPSTLVTLDLVLRLIGRLAFPIFCFLLVEGFLHTHDVRRYFLQLLGFGLVSELPFDLAFFHTPFYWGHQNVYWTLALGVLAMAALRYFQTAAGAATWQGLLCAGGCILLAYLAQTDYDGIGVIIICALYLTRTNRKWQCLVGAVLFAFEITAPLAFVFLWFYNGQRGACSKAQKWGFYLFYPVHLAVLACITNLLL